MTVYCEKLKLYHYSPDEALRASESWGYPNF